MTPLEAFKVHMGELDDVDDALLAQKLDVAGAWVSRIIGEPVNDASPAPIHEATRMLAAHLFECREAALVGISAQEMPFGVMDLLDPYRKW